MLLAAPQQLVDYASAYHIELGIERMWPVDRPGRDIDTTSFNVLVGRGLFDQEWLVWRAGVTGTYATGSIMQLDEHFHDVRLYNSAVGLGPVGLLRLQTPELARLRLSLEGSGGFIVYSEHFPAGGDIYNFMWRAGLSLEARISARCSLGLGYRVMHVSNGQGLGPQNPSYEARGFSLWFGWIP